MKTPTQTNNKINMINAQQIAKAICYHYLTKSGKKYIGAVPEFTYGNNETWHRADILILAKNHTTTEIEIKMSWQDYCNDKKKKHIETFKKEIPKSYFIYILHEDKHIPNNFIYASHDIKLCQKIKEDIKNTKFGVRHITLNKDGSLKSSQLIKKPTQIHDKRQDSESIEEFLYKACLRITETKYNLYKDYNKT